MFRPRLVRALAPSAQFTSIARSSVPQSQPRLSKLSLKQASFPTAAFSSKSLQSHSRDQIPLSSRILAQIWHSQHLATSSSRTTRTTLRPLSSQTPKDIFSTRPGRKSRVTPLCSPSPLGLHHHTFQRAFSNRSTPHARYDPYRHQNARPLITPQQLASMTKKPTFRLTILLSVGGALIFYFAHIEEVPVSGRKRFNCFSEASAEAQGQMAYQQIMQQEGAQGKILPPYDRRVRQVERVLGRLIDGGNLGSGHSGQGSSWEVHVIDDPGTANAFVLPGGKVFVYSGILPICQDDNGLAAVLGHEIAHNLAHHSAERMSSMVILQPIVWLFQYLDATGVTLGFGGFLSRLMLDLGVMRPASREQESEADYIGLLLMAECCYDPHAAVGLWERMEQAQKGAPPEWLSTHPSNASRIARIAEWLPKAEDKRQESDCGALMPGYADGFQRAISRTFVF